MTKNLPKYQYIDSLRGIAIIAVLLVHTAVFYGEGLSPVLKTLASSGRYGVQLFFIVSAFTLFLSLSARKVEKHPLKNFFIRRVFRIVPLFYLAVIGYLFLDNWFEAVFAGNSHPISKESVLATFLFVNGFNPYWINNVIGVNWSVAVEFVFYLLVPLLFVYITELRRSIAAFLIFLAIGLTLAYIMSQHCPITDREQWNWFMYFFLPAQMPVFAMGFVWYYSVKGRNPESKSKHTGMVCYVVFILLYFVGCFVRPPFVPVHYVISAAYLALCFAVYLFPLKIIVNNITAFIGKISFSIYLVHWAVAQRMNGLLHIDRLEDNLHPVVFYLACFVVLLSISVFVSYFTYRLIEEPFIRLGKKLINKLEEK